MVTLTKRHWPTVAAVLSFVVLSVAGIQYTNHVSQQSERKWCRLVVTLDSTYQESPPQTDVGKRVAEDIHMLRRDFGCD